jgi:hypothetical protein
VVLAEPRAEFSKAIGALAKEIASHAPTSAAAQKPARRKLLTRS